MTPPATDIPRTPGIRWQLRLDLKPLRSRRLGLPVLLPARDLVSATIHQRNTCNLPARREILDEDLSNLRDRRISQARPELAVVVRPADVPVGAVATASGAGVSRGAEADGGEISFACFGVGMEVAEDVTVVVLVGVEAELCQGVDGVCVRVTVESAEEGILSPLEP